MQSSHTIVPRKELPDPLEGIEVREQELRVLRAERVYRLRCDCGRSWLEAELPGITECPACHRLAVVTE